MHVGAVYGLSCVALSVLCCCSFHLYCCLLMCVVWCFFVLSCVLLHVVVRCCIVVACHGCPLFVVLRSCCTVIRLYVGVAYCWFVLVCGLGTFDMFSGWLFLFGALCCSL